MAIQKAFNLAPLFPPTKPLIVVLIQAVGAESNGDLSIHHEGYARSNHSPFPSHERL
jgi:hypothetical protein